MSGEFTLREALVAASSIVADKHPIPALRKVWLGEGHVCSSDGALSLQIPCKVPFDGGVDGKVLIQILGKDEDETEFEVEDKSLSIKQGKRKRVKLPLQGSSARLSGLLKLDKTLLSLALEDMNPVMLVNMTKNRMKEALIDGEVGTVVFEPRVERLILYTTDRQSIHRGTVKTDWQEGVTLRSVVPLRFLELISKFKDKLEHARLYFTPKSVFVLDESGFCIHALTVRVKTALNFERAMDNVWIGAKRDSEKAFKLPTTFSEALQRAKVVLALDDDVVTLMIERGNLIISAKSRKGEFSERFKLKEEVDDAECDITLKTLIRVAPRMRKMYLSEHGVFMYGPGRFVCAISSKRGH